MPLEIGEILLDVMDVLRIKPMFKKRQMLLKLSVIASTIFNPLTASAATTDVSASSTGRPSHLMKMLDSVGTPGPGSTLIQPITPIEIDISPWTGIGLSQIEQEVLEALQKRGITDKTALAVIMGNIQQESRFVPNICEGGARVPYNHCHRGGYGLIQWTSIDRYNGLGRHAARTQQNPSSKDAQIDYIFMEKRWKDVEHIFKSEGKSIAQYMDAAYHWLGWGIHGNRTHYSRQYLSKLVPSS